MALVRLFPVMELLCMKRVYSYRDSPQRNKAMNIFMTIDCSFITDGRNEESPQNDGMN